MSAARSRSRRRRSGAWPLWVRLLVVAAVAAGVVWVWLWFRELGTWWKVLIGVGAVVVLALWWLVTRRHEIAAEMERRARAEAAERRKRG